ncbi:general secretion pathway protein GspK [Chitinimonas arctica]|uniref:Type II secretion system protein K n=1 Tax=Chitinimonas arctica TaxID=2594795 RepID=A0A516SIJ6_9NEIS|nr:type II secretion system minor pseudopilin GspK [Chitinimonas arctica]QDQ27975.1 general secretion pathway protein GspK [Chitinimonas arctica]
MRTRPSKQAGIAIITAVAIAALVAAIAGAMAFRHSLWLRQVANQLDMTQARVVARSAVDFSLLTLLDDAKQNLYDGETDSWRIPISNLPIEQGMADGKIYDVQGRFNLNNLLETDPAKLAIYENAFKTLLANAGGSPDLLNALADWLDEGSNVRNPGGAEDNEYMAMNPPRRAANGPLFDVEELRQVRGFSDELVEKLMPNVSALPYPPSGPASFVNVNFVSAEVLNALVPQISLSQAEALVAQAKKKPFQNIADFYAALGSQQLTQQLSTSNIFSIKSDYFLTDVEARFGRVKVAYRAMLTRDNSSSARLIWLRRR